MRQIKCNGFITVIAASLVFISCNQPETKVEGATADTTMVARAEDKPAIPAYDPAMDSYNMQSEAIKKLKDTLGIKMYEVSIKPGEIFPLHSHPDHTAYVLQGGKAALYIKEVGKTDTVDFPTGFSIVSGPFSDSGKNIGKTTIKMVIADIYRPRNN
ncbi:hypothetical protein [Flavihumibacter sp.]|uniref:hypothetical protein n=1 Tax=Flavihumibacter sp. TaxID=1913981 RepID=UPI002FC98DC0